uniref:AF4/FMR2 family member 1 n=1 Tax=Microcebus murinus TaxID=30608 RepID=A0A8C5XLR5_MICMU
LDETRSSPEQEAFRKTPLFGEPYKTAKGDELSSRLQNMLGDYEEVKEFFTTKPYPHRPDAPESRPGKPKHPSLPDRGGVPATSFHASAHLQSPLAPASAPPPAGALSHHPRMAQPRVEPVPGAHAKSYGPPDSQRPAPGRPGQEATGCHRHRKGDRRADGQHCAPAPSLAAGRELSPLMSSLPSPIPPLSPVHSSQPSVPRMQASSKVPSSSSSYCPARSPQDLAVKVHEKEAPDDSLGAAPPPSQAFPPPSLPSKSVPMQHKPTAYVRPMDGQDQAPSESPELKPPPGDYRQQAFEKADPKVPAKAKLAKLKMPAQAAQQTYSNEVHCVEEILKEMTHSWPPPLTAVHTPGTAEPSKFPFPTKDSQHITSATQNQKQYDTSSKTHSSSQQGTSVLEHDLQLSDSEDSDSEQVSSVHLLTPAILLLIYPPASAHSSSGESESTSDSDSSSDSESQSSSSDSEENEPLETPAPEPEPPATNKWQLDNWLTKVGPPAAAPEVPAVPEPARRRQDNKDSGDSGSSSQERAESKDPPPRSSGKAARVPPEGPQAGKRSFQKSPARQEPPQRQTVGTKQPRRPGKVPGPVAGLQVESEPGPPPCGATREQQAPKDKPKVKTKGRPRAATSGTPGPGDRKKHKGSLPALSVPEATKGSVGDRSPGPATAVPETPSQGSGPRTSGGHPASVARDDGRRDRLPPPPRDPRSLSPLGNSPAPPPSLVVRISLGLLSRVPPPPQGTGSSRQRKPPQQQGDGQPPPAGRKPDPEKRSGDSSSKAARKRKVSVERPASTPGLHLGSGVSHLPLLFNPSPASLSQQRLEVPALVACGSYPSRTVPVRDRCSLPRREGSTGVSLPSDGLLGDNVVFWGRVPIYPEDIGAGRLARPSTGGRGWLNACHPSTLGGRGGRIARGQGV